jgi:Beta-lactamase
MPCHVVRPRSRGPIIQRNAGTSLTQYLRPRLLDPLGIGPVGWHTFPPGREQGFSGLHARTEDVAKLGLLYLQRGQWEGTQLIPAAWVDVATSQQVSNPGEPSLDWQQGYGFQFWMSRHGYRGDGAFGQFCVILPEQATVIATTAYTLDMQAVLDAMWAHLLPGLGAAPPGASAADGLLSARLAALELPTCRAAPAPESWDPWTSGPFTVAGSTAGTEVPASFTAVEVGPGNGSWQIGLIEPANALTVPVGAGSWAVSEHADRGGAVIPVAASGGWLDGRTLRAEIIFLETPHRMDITCSLDGRTARAQWRHPPLTPSKLQHLHCPR